ncbi:ABC transporter substrate-binding protein [Paenibacillus cellulositrophicus]|uniref:ABC transporter substrate-binding protein n=1 Tax=Paenibacillus cellulositrophicus TaxID=562959 RepID=UPI001266FEEB|nr:ABC transporter substrate-binding protein [Paenibacillus cellulositrophicus]
MFTRSKSSFTVMILVVMLSMLVTACGGNSGGSGSAASGGTAAETSGKETAASDSKEAASDGGTRTYKTEKGDVEIPVKPQRIVTDYYGGELLSVGAPVVGAEPSIFQNPFLKDKLNGVEDVGYPINTEKALSLKPDLIVVMYDDNYEALSKIAPTIYIPYGTATNVDDTVRLFGDIAGEEEKAEEFIKAFDEKAAAAWEKLKGVVDENATFGIYELTDKGELWTFGDNAGRGGQVLYNALQLKRPAKNSKENQTLQLSMELLPEYAADYMFLTTYDPEKKGDKLKELKASPVWNSLAAAKNDRIFYNDFDTFYRYDPIAIMGQIDLFVDMILEHSGKK